MSSPSLGRLWSDSVRETHTHTYLLSRTTRTHTHTHTVTHTHTAVFDLQCLLTVPPLKKKSPGIKPGIFAGWLEVGSWNLVIWRGDKQTGIVGKKQGGACRKKKRLMNLKRRRKRDSEEGGRGQCSLTMGMMMCGCWMWSRRGRPCQSPGAWATATADEDASASAPVKDDGMHNGMPIMPYVSTAGRPTVSSTAPPR